MGLDFSVLPQDSHLAQPLSSELPGHTDGWTEAGGLVPTALKVAPCVEGFWKILAWVPSMPLPAHAVSNSSTF